jgi:hypothetical protein
MAEVIFKEKAKITIPNSAVEYAQKMINDNPGIEKSN